ncbi:hypothetical protein NLX83_34495 [Allokutzneria sp. A3M-2-11 16]|uniref:hypothetical protein n=1 Tax=Allokutzneria sp. A3M-2-11 16 TaxID=2962043 RepID=UPI0020B8E446|nr:hypothetical protein [Allokutzneria sp. A3M-2-11 16]MCP3804390.1 hypothetical protein [Allokutzneria sp. A3M-2-11 16]
MKKRAAAVLAGTAAMMAVSTPAQAIGIGLDTRPTPIEVLNNVSVLPVQLCGAGSCRNAPVGDDEQKLITNSHVGP